MMRASFWILRENRFQIMMPLLRCWITVKIQNAWRNHCIERSVVQYVASPGYMAQFFPVKNYNQAFENHCGNMAAVLKWVKVKRLKYVKPMLHAFVLAHHEDVWHLRSNYEWIGFVEVCHCARDVVAAVNEARDWMPHMERYIEAKMQWTEARNWMARYMSMSATLGSLACTQGSIDDEMMNNMAQTCAVTGKETEEWVRTEWCVPLLKAYAKSERRNTLKEREYFGKYGNINSIEQACYALKQNARFVHEPVLTDPCKFQDQIMRAAFLKEEPQHARILHSYMFLRLKKIINESKLGNGDALDYRRFCHENVQWGLNCILQTMVALDKEATAVLEQGMADKIAQASQGADFLQCFFELEDLVPRIINARMHAKMLSMQNPRLDKANVGQWWKGVLKRTRFVESKIHKMIKPDQPREFEKPAKVFTDMIIMASSEKPPEWDEFHIQSFREEYQKILARVPTLERERIHISIEIAMLIKEEQVGDAEMAEIHPLVGPFINKINRWAMVHFDVFGQIYKKSK